MGFKNKKQKYIVSLLISYLLILLIPVFCNCLAHHKTIKIFKEDMKQYNLSALEHIMDTIEDSIEDTESLVRQLA